MQPHQLPSGPAADDPGQILKVKSLKELVYDYLGRQLSEGGIRPGEAINLDATSRRLGVSKTPLREALIMLEMEGFVTISPRRGIFVRGLGREEIRDIYQVIGALESTAMLESADRFGQAQAVRMQSLNRRMQEALARDDFNEYYARNLDFHSTYLELPGNQVLLRTITVLKKRLYDFPRQTGFLKEWEEASILEHQRIAELAAAGDFRAAADYIREVHWSFRVQERFIDRYYQLGARD